MAPVRVGILAFVLVVLGLSVWMGLRTVSSASNGEVNYKLDLRNGHNLKVVFDAGLRPKRNARIDNWLCEILNVPVDVILPGGGQFSMDVSVGFLSVLAGNEIRTIELAGRPEPLQDAVSRVREICRAAGIPSEGFERKLEHIGHRILGTETWAATAGDSEMRTSVSFLPISDLGGEHRAQVWVWLKWPKTGGEPMKFLSGPIQPPPGYEDVSMDPPPEVGLSPFELKRRDDAERAQAGKGSPGVAASVEPTSSMPPHRKVPEQPQGRPPRPREGPDTSWCPMLTSIALAGLATVLVLWRRLSRERKGSAE